MLRLDAGGFTDGHLFADGHVGIGADEPVQRDLPFVPIFQVSGHRLGGCVSFALNFDDVADFHPDLRHVLRGQPHDPSAGVPGGGRGHGQLQIALLLLRGRHLRISFCLIDQYCSVSAHAARWAPTATDGRRSLTWRTPLLSFQWTASGWIAPGSGICS